MEVLIYTVMAALAIGAIYYLFMENDDDV